jgi:putative endonuclease
MTDSEAPGSDTAAADGALLRQQRTRAQHALGHGGERRAAEWYRCRGYRLLDQNWRCRNGELDLVLRRRGVIVFCEVKARSSRRFGHPIEAVTPTKQQRIRSLALQWLSTTGHRGKELRFDVAAVERGRVEVWEAAF